MRLISNGKICAVNAKEQRRQQYETGFKDGMKNALLKIAADANAKEVEICLLHHMKWEDDGCCMDCVECVKRHLEG